MLAKNLKYLVKRFAVTQSQLALWLNVRQTTISNWINEISTPSVDELAGLYHYFGISVQDLIFTDLENGNLITDQHVAIFQQKGNLKGNPIGNLMAQNQQFLLQETQAEYVKKQQQPATLESIQSQLAKLTETVENIRLSLENKAIKDGSIQG